MVLRLSAFNEQRLPFGRKKVASAKSEEDFTTNHKTEFMLLIMIKLTDKSDRCIEIRIIGGLIPHGFVFQDSV